MLARNRLFIAVITCCVLLGGCGGSGDDDDIASTGGSGDSVPGVFSISAYHYTDPPPANDQELLQRYLEARDLVESTGANGQFQSYHWADLEPITGQYDQSKLQEFADTMESAEDRGLTQLVGLQVINTVTREVPQGLENTAWDNPAMVQAFTDLLDQLLPHLQGRVRYLSIGNEVDSYFVNSRVTELPAYQSFFNSVRSHLNARLAGVDVGITVTAKGWLGSDVQNWLDLTERHDVLITTYYPLDSDYDVEPANSPAADFPELLSYAGNRDLVIQEVGYPSSIGNNSSETLQSEFVRQVFNAWQDADGQITFLNWFLLHDFSTDLVDDFVDYYGEDDPGFRAFLDSLGLRNRDNTNKLAWSTLLNETRAFRN